MAARPEFSSPERSGPDSFVLIPDLTPWTGPDKAKKQRARDIDLDPWAVELFKRIPNRNAEDCIAGTEEKDGWYTKRFRKLCQLSGFHIKNNDGKWVSRWGNNAMRHTFGTMDYARHLDPARTSRLMGHKRCDDMLFTHYRAKANKQDAERYFNVGGAMDTYVKHHPTTEQLEQLRQASHADHGLAILDLVAEYAKKDRARKAGARKSSTRRKS